MPKISTFTIEKQKFLKKYKEKDILFIKTLTKKQQEKWLKSAISKTMCGKKLNQLESVVYNLFLEIIEEKEGEKNKQEKIMQKHALSGKFGTKEILETL